MAKVVHGMLVLMLPWLVAMGCSGDSTGSASSVAGDASKLEPVASSNLDRAGVADMAADRTLTIVMFNVEGGRNETAVLKPGDRDYDSVRDIVVGGISPGQRKDIPHYIARVDMEESGTIILAPFGAGSDPITSQQRIRPGTARYQEIMSVVPDLKPGTKP